jgi:hypothetical protein
VGLTHTTGSSHGPLRRGHDRRTCCIEMAGEDRALSHSSACMHSSTVFQERFGFCFVTGVPANPEDTERLSRQIAHIRETQCSHFVVDSILMLIRENRWWLLGLHCRPKAW